MSWEGKSDLSELLPSVCMYVSHTHTHAHTRVSSEEAETIKIPVFAARNTTPNYTGQVQRGYGYFEKG